jgi:competence ComEA-like helix-hairpin-helix protein
VSEGWFTSTREKQLIGVMILLIAGLAVTAVKTATRTSSSLFFRSPPTCSEQAAGSTIVQVVAPGAREGIYFFPNRPTVADVLEQAAPGKIFLFDDKTLQKKIPGGYLASIDLRGPSIRLERIDARTKLSLEMPIDINEATMKDLVLIPGIGPATARAIVTLRNSRSGFRSISELTDVRGIGGKRLEDIGAYLTLDREKGW